MHLKRKKIENFWPIPRKGTKYVALATHNKKDSIPLVIVMRDIFKVVKNKKELKKAMNEKLIQVNNKEVRETNYPISLFDIITFHKKNYRAVLSSNKKMIFEEISDKEAETKIFKVLGRKILSNKKTQLNLMQGKNILSEEKVGIGDSIMLNLKDDKIIKVIPIEKGKDAFVMKGKHASSKGKIEEIVEEGGKKIARITSNNEKINVWIKNIIVM